MSKTFLFHLLCRVATNAAVKLKEQGGLQSLKALHTHDKPTQVILIICFS